ncbi:hypothetical protein [Shimia abyssi]|uniref:MOSC domain-containing protein n=1 Tax=Shimia abyssi TaxID=1662395 RepID=A0A2P8FC86_9RHOB|nr:hypothetical protein [Shimia abyssi]PSL19298.1 hypothetical protein CLV88_1069 [Shimia abyssi]
MPVSETELNEALPHVMAAPKDEAAIDMLCLRPERNTRKFVDEISLTCDQGIPGERWLEQPWLRTENGAPHPGIQVSILPRRVLDLVWLDRDNTVHPGDTFVADMDMSLVNLPTGQYLEVGGAILKVSDVFNDGCVKWKARYGTAAKDWITAPGHPELRLRGILCSIERDGEIRKGDVLRKVDGFSG